MDNNNKFNYTYSAPTEQERREIESIRRQYQKNPVSQDKNAEIRRLDAHVKNVPTAVALVVGVVSTLIFGGGMSIAIEAKQLLIGIPIGILGALGMAITPLLYKWIFASQKKKYGPRILQLSDELLGKTDTDDVDNVNKS